MVASSFLSLFVAATLFSAPTTAAPTRTTCHCTIVPVAPPATPPQSIYSPSAAHWAPQDPSPSPVARQEEDDFCSTLGEELESFPDAARAYILSHAPQTPFPVGFSTRDGKSRDAQQLPRLQTEKIVCRSEQEVGTRIEDSMITLWALQIIVFIAIFACVAEGVHLGLRNFRGRSASLSAYRQFVQFPGAIDEKRLLLAVPTTMTADILFSPGAEKKLRSYEFMPALVLTEKKEAVAYAEAVGDEDDDEVNRPVM